VTASSSSSTEVSEGSSAILDSTSEKTKQEDSVQALVMTGQLISSITYHPPSR
jgi:hypothetical protein